MNKFVWPLVLFAALVVFLAIGLQRDPTDVPSPLVGKAAPAFSLEQLDAKAPRLGPADMRGKVWLLNVWSTWCVTCRQEHPVLVELGKQKIVPIVGLNYKEVRGDAELDAGNLQLAEETQLARQRAASWMQEHGNPYDNVVLDIDGRVGIDYGVYGVPETYVIDKAGVIRFKQTGAITPQVLQEKILPLIQELSK